MAAAVFGGWVGQAVVENLVKTVSSYLRNQMEWEANVKTALNKLNHALLSIQVVLEQAEKVELNLDQNPTLESFIWMLRDAVEEAEDVLDEMEYQRIERQILERDATEKVRTPAVSSSTDFKFKLIKFFKLHGCFSASLFKHNCVKIGKRAINKDDTLSKLDVVVRSLERVAGSIHVLEKVINTSPQLRGGSNSNPKNHRETGHLLKDEVVGRDEDKKKVLKWLNDSEGDKQGSSHISALLIWGIGGVGKTTIAQSMYNEPSLDFQVKMWVCVSNNNLGMEEIMKKAIESATGNLPSADSMTNLQQKLRVVVESKRCLLVLDDVWDGQTNQEQEQWQDFIGVLSQYAERGSKILITSRVKHHIFPKITTDFRLGCLKEDESLSLLYKHAFTTKNRLIYSGPEPLYIRQKPLFNLIKERSQTLQQTAVHTALLIINSGSLTAVYSILPAVKNRC